MTNKFHIERKALTQHKETISELYHILRNYDNAASTAIIRVLGATKSPSKRFLRNVKAARRNSIDLIPKSEQHLVWTYLNTIINHNTRAYRALYGRYDQKEYFDTKALYRALTTNTCVGRIMHNGRELHYIVAVTPTLVSKLKINLAPGCENALNHIDRHYKVCWFEPDLLDYVQLCSLTCETKEEIIMGLKHYLSDKPFNHEKPQAGTWTCTRCYNVFDNEAHYAIMSGNKLDPKRGVMGTINKIRDGGIECWCGERMCYNFPNKPRFVDAIFDYARQCWIRPTDLHVINDDDVGKNWDFSCPKCFGPATMVSCDAHGERHRCLNCGHPFTVK